ncbi:endoplasmic reticulum aminopeptidase 2 isoform X1 [Chelonia mydas]|uniref:endoplasmic reticulum aminopeptidase 2 isoform X1 n=2 Tax=Chelonia mydas TaxID=8469 RepID=UPI0018A23EE7|nr:endoplasmic reticulum aminopeptidase 2 isoform X1 [Chelonia mydas]XP_043402679.1 endoplasmic reticulum aminopeptidase 2 isoform X1 [Chelonia mydas]
MHAFAMASLCRICPLVVVLQLLHIYSLGIYGLKHQTGKDNVTSPTNGKPFPWNKMRLPDMVVPIQYDLCIHPNLTTVHFTGLERIQIFVRENTRFIILHSKGLEITSAVLLPKDDLGSRKPGKQLQVLEHPTYEQIALQAPEVLTAGQRYLVVIEFHARLADGFDGFYKSTYKTRDGETRIIATTDFEPTSARMAFPCFDEPSFKANFAITIRRERKHIALSNMPKIKTIELEGGLLEDHFDVTVKMSTYLVAYIVCDFKSVQATTSSGIKVSIYASPDKWSQTHYALEASVKLLEFYEKYFDISFPLPKLDLVAIPDFQSGAMENWGLITYRETSLLYDPKTSSAFDKLWVTKVIGHELAHQWFGNLVTMEWWNDIWLNEGFARFMELVSVSATYSELQIEDYFLNVCFGAIARDSLNSSHPISNPAETPIQIKEMFDTVSYDKGACILKMLQDFLSEVVFQKGIIHYLKKYSYRNAKNGDLWNSMANTCSESDFSSGNFCYTASRPLSSTFSHMGKLTEIEEMMNTWTLQKGIPLVLVKCEGNTLRLRQERFLKGVFEEDPEWANLQSRYFWHIPLTYVTSSSNTVHRHIFKTKTDTLELEGEVAWVKFNVDMNGYYIVHYEGNGWDNIIKLLDQNHTLFSHKDRVNLIHNGFQLVSAGRLSLHTALDLMRYLRHESSKVVLLQGLGYLEMFYHMMERRNISDVTENLKRYILQHFKPVIDKQTWSDEGSVSDRMLRSALLKLACELQYPPCIQKANELFSKWMGSGGTLNLPADVLKTVYSVGAQTIAGWNYLLKQYSLSVSGAEKNKILYALTTSRHCEKLTKLIELGMEGEVIKTQDLAALLHAIARNPEGQGLAWNFVRKNWNRLLKKFELASFSIRTIIVGSTSHFSSKDKLEEVKHFFKSLEDQGSQLKITEVVLETITKNIRWLKRNLNSLRNWLLNNL